MRLLFAGGTEGFRVGLVRCGDDWSASLVRFGRENSELFSGVTAILREQMNL
jgi:hypothetical protein